jgi:DNA-binding NarL/FixJ family response regulator
VAPDVVVADLDLVTRESASAVREVRDRLTTGGVIIFTGMICWRTLAGAVRAGAAGVVLKSDPLESLAEAIRVVARGETYLSRSLPRELLDAVHRAPDLLGVLSDREREVFHLVVRGLTNRRIGRELFISPKQWIATVAGSWTSSPAGRPSSWCGSPT